MTAEQKLSDAIDAFQRGDLDRARMLAEQQLEDDSGSPPLQHLLGLIDCRRGRVDSGVKWLRRASEAEPENLQFRVMLVRALVDSGHPREALDAATGPADSSPAALALWHARAEAADAAKESAAAIEAWGRLATARPDDWKAWSNYGNALAAADRWGDAVTALKRAIGLNPAEVALRRSLASALAQAGRHQEAADQLQLWVDAAPDDAENRILLARLLADLGRNEESFAQLDEAARLATGKGWSGGSKGLIEIAESSGQLSIGLLREIGRLLERASLTDALGELIGQAEERGINRERFGYPAAAIALRDGDPAEAKRLLLADDPRIDPVHWHWLMARIADALGDSETAFDEAEAMNRSAQGYDRWRKNAADHLEWLRGLAAIITTEWGSRLQPLECGDRRSPAMLVGFPRSGTTLLDTFLMGHPEVTVLEEVPLMHVVERPLGKLAGLPDRSRQELSQARAAYLAELDRHVAPGFGGLIIDKLPLKLLAVPFIHAMLPDTRVLFAQRHPCDCVLSCFMQAFSLNNSMACFLDIHDAAAFYDGVMSFWTRVRQTLPINVHTVVYEQLVEDPEAALRPVIDFLGLEWRGELLDHRSTAKARGAISTPSYDQVVQPISTKASGRWRRYEKQLEPVLPILLPWAERLGYEA